MIKEFTKNDKEMDYLCQIQEKYDYSLFNRDKAKEILNSIGFRFWVIEKQGKKLGVVYISYFPDLGIYTFDSYRDNGTTGKDIVFMKRDIEEVLAMFLKSHNEIFTAHDIRNKKATRACEKLGFYTIKYFDSEIGTFILMKKEGENHGN